MAGSAVKDFPGPRAYNRRDVMSRTVPRTGADGIRETGRVRRADDQLREVLFEFIRIGNVRRVNALDPVTGTEVSMIWARGYGRELVKRMAARKLAYVIRKKRERAEAARRRRSSGTDTIV